MLQIHPFAIIEVSVFSLQFQNKMVYVKLHSFANPNDEHFVSVSNMVKWSMCTREIHNLSAHNDRLREQANFIVLDSQKPQSCLQSWLRTRWKMAICGLVLLQLELKKHKCKGE